VFTTRYALSPYTKQIRFVFKGLITHPQFETVALQRRYAAQIGSWLPTFRNSLSLEGGTDRLSRNVFNYQSTPRNIREG
jgi:hypothetical protein